MNTYNDLFIEFESKFNEYWYSLMDSSFFRQEQFLLGNRLRPKIVFAGYLAAKSHSDISKNDIELVSKLSLSMELIHKASIILDDLIDDDPKRHGKPTFHKEYGSNITYMFAANLLSISIKNLDDYISDLPDTDVLRKKGIHLLAQTMYDMSLGEVKELQLDSINKFNKALIKNIISLETVPLIRNSLLLGYYAGDNYDEKVEKALRNIGDTCGYVFQILNDLEPFCNSDKLIAHKGRLNMDLQSDKKNIALALLYELLSDDELKSITDKTLPQDERDKI